MKVSSTNDTKLQNKFCSLQNTFFPVCLVNKERQKECRVDTINGNRNKKLIEEVVIFIPLTTNDIEYDKYVV